MAFYGGLLGDSGSESGPQNALGGLRVQKDTLLQVLGYLLTYHLRGDICPTVLHYPSSLSPDAQVCLSLLKS